MNNLTTNRNFLSPLGFKLLISSPEFANLEYFTQSAALPSVTLGAVETPFRSSAGFQPGDKIEYEPLTIKFAVDENMANYVEVLGWIQSCAASVATPSKTLVKDATLLVMNAKNVVTTKFKFANCFPTSLSAIEFSTQATDIEYATATVVLRYDYFVKL